MDNELLKINDNKKKDKTKMQAVGRVRKSKLVEGWLHLEIPPLAMTVMAHGEWRWDSCPLLSTITGLKLRLATCGPWTLGGPQTMSKGVCEK